MCFLHNFRHFFVKLLSPGRVCNFIRSVRQLCNNVNGMRSARVHIRAVNIYSAAGEAFFFFFFPPTINTRTTKWFLRLIHSCLCHLAHLGRTQKKQKFICLVFPAPIDETVSASNHSVLSFNLFFSFLFFQPSTSNRPADCALSHPISCAISTVALISRDCLNCFVSSSDSV